MGLFSKKETQNVTIRFVIEILGKPKEHIESVMNSVAEQLKEQKEFTSKNVTISPTEEHDGMFHIFTTAEIEFKTIPSIFAFCFEYLPSSAEIISPTEFEVGINSMTGIINDFLGRLHESDMVAKRTRADNEILQKNSTQIFRNFLRFAISSGKKKSTEISAVMGIPESDIDKFITPFVKEGWVKKTEHGFELQ